MLRAVVVPAIASHCLYRSAVRSKSGNVPQAAPRISERSGSVAAPNNDHGLHTRDAVTRSSAQFSARIGSVGCKKVRRYAALG